jgi:hypothetical protein
MAGVARRAHLIAVRTASLFFLPKLDEQLRAALVNYTEMLTFCEWGTKNFIAGVHFGQRVEATLHLGEEPGVAS